jgi:putative endonuclease
MRRDEWWVYMIECRGGRIYTGIAKDPDARYRAHVSGKGAAFTRMNPPRRLLGRMRCAGRGQALREERALRRLPRAGKIAWATGAVRSR